VKWRHRVYGHDTIAMLWVWWVELKGEDRPIWSCSRKIESVTLRKCPHDHWLTNKAYLSAITVTSIFRVLPTRWWRKPAGIDTERNYVTVALCVNRNSKCMHEYDINQHCSRSCRLHANDRHNNICTIDYNSDVYRECQWATDDQLRKCRRYLNAFVPRNTTRCDFLILRTVRIIYYSYRISSSRSLSVA